MKKLLLLTILLFAGLAITGCTQKNQVPEQENGSTENELFEKKQECAKYESTVLEYLESLNDGDFDYTLVEIQYSPVLNTCIFGSNMTTRGLGNSSYFIEDVLTKKELKYNNGSYAGNEIEYNQKMKELKGE